MSTISPRKHSAKVLIDQAVRAALSTSAGQRPRTRAAFEALFRHARRAGLVHGDLPGERAHASATARLVGGLLALATHQRDWLRPVTTWEPLGTNPMPMFASLAEHLLAAYPMPRFLASVWLEPTDAEARRHQAWYKLIGAGRNIRSAGDLLFAYTSKMAHHFLLAPDHLSVGAALRWGEVRGLGGSRQFGLALGTTRLAHDFTHPEFWRSVVQFFANHPDFDPDLVGPTVDYLDHQKFAQAEETWWEGRTQTAGPPEPNLTMKGRTPRALIRQVNAWHAMLKRPKRWRSVRWAHSEIDEFSLVERDLPTDLRCWTIRELGSSDALWNEEKAMRHCAGTYVARCVSRATSVWSMRFENHEQRCRVATIEVDLASRTICQIKRRGNAPAKPKDLAILRTWAASAGLKLGFWFDGALVTE